MAGATSRGRVIQALGGEVPQTAVEGLEDSLADLQEAIDDVEAGVVTEIDGGTP